VPGLALAASRPASELGKDMEGSGRRRARQAQAPALLNMLILACAWRTATAYILPDEQALLDWALSAGAELKVTIGRNPEVRMPAPSSTASSSARSART
jgi:hypothetical protein